MEENAESIDDNRSKEENSLKKEPINTSDENNKNKILDKNKIDKNLELKNDYEKKDPKAEIKKQDITQTVSNELKIKPKKEIPIEKKPFNEFVNEHLLPSIIDEFKERGFEVNDINLKYTSRPIAGDKCWVIYCEIRDVCNFWLSFEKEDISSLKSISLCRCYEKPSIIESFLIDEKRITLKLIISRILQRLNGQKLIGIN